jgi:hypothetical protein
MEFAPLSKFKNLNLGGNFGNYVSCHDLLTLKSMIVF